MCFCAEHAFGVTVTHHVDYMHASAVQVQGQTWYMQTLTISATVC